MLSIRAAGPTIHQEAIDWATRASSNGGVISSNVIRAVSQFCADIDRNNLRDRFLRLNLFSGGNLSGALVPLYRSTAFGGTVIGNATDTNNNFVSGDYLETGATGGLLGNGSTKALLTGVLANNLSLGDAHLSAHVATGTTVGNYACAIGALTTTPTGLSLHHCQIYTNQFAYSQFNTSGPGFSGANPTGLMLTTSISLSDRRCYLDGYQSGATEVGAITSSQPAVGFSVFCCARPALVVFSSARISTYSIGLGMTGDKVAAFNKALAAFRAALGRA